MNLKEINNTYIPKIPYEDLVHIEFQPEVTLTEVEEKQRLHNINRACSAGNLYKTKYKITFQTTGGLLMVETTVWMVGKKYLLIKGNLCIPIHSIVNIT
tara:strand:- start:558 stop:854 length:297 start_codon:yes stop_codon:yes gene_type:complete